MIAPPVDASIAPVAPAAETVSSSRTARWLVVAGVGLPTLLILVIMSGMFGRFQSVSGFPFFSVDFHWPALLTPSTPTGGDMGAHVLLPQYLRDNLLPSGQIIGWSNDWYAGYPAMYFYFPLPALTTVLLDVFIPYGVAFKITTMLGLVTLPISAFLFARFSGFSRQVAAITAAVGAMYVFMESFSIFGGNVKSTMAGEFSFSWSLSLSLIYLGVVIKQTREGRTKSWLPGVLLAATALSHVVTTMVVVAVSLPLLIRRNGARVVTRSWLIGFLLSAFWSVPFAIRVFQGMTTDMGWFPVKGLVGNSAFPGTVATPLPNEFIPIFVLGLIGIVWTMMRRDDITVLIWMTVAPFVGYWILQLDGVGFTKIYNARLLPYWYLGMYLFAGLAIGLGVAGVAKWLPSRRQNLAMAGALALLVVINITAVGIRDLPGWVRWNYTGYEGKPVYNEFEGLLNEVDALPPGRVMWEANSSLNQYGTPMALMTIPYFNENHQSMEGLFFESSLTTPFHFLNAAEVSERPSNPVRGLNYRSLDFDRAVPHLAMYNVSYYVSFTETATAAARDHGLEELAAPAPFTVFALPESQLVDVATMQPSVWAGDEDFFEASLLYYDDVERLDQWLVEDGVESWPRIEEVAERPTLGVPAGGTVSDIVLEDQRISFRTTAVGVPHMVKVSYFPNWEAQGAEGPFRASPSLMVVVPTEEEVVLEFSNTWAENSGNLLTLVTIAAIGGGAYLRRRDEMPI